MRDDRQRGVAPWKLRPKGANLYMDDILKKIVIFVIISGFILYSVSHIISTGKAEEFILEHSQESWAPGSMYNLGNFFLIFQADQRAEGVFEVIVDSFSNTGYYEKAYYKYFTIAAGSRSRKRAALMRGEDFLREFPDSEKAEIVENRISILKKL